MVEIEINSGALAILGLGGVFDDIAIIVVASDLADAGAGKGEGVLGGIDLR